MNPGYAGYAGYPGYQSPYQPQYPPQQYPPQQYPPQQYPPQQYPPMAQGPINFRNGLLQNYNDPMGINPAPMPFSSEPTPTTKHMHPLFPENTQRECKVCKKLIRGGPGFVCRSCELSLCYDCFRNIYHGKKFENIHPHPLVLRVRNDWLCNNCRKHYIGTASFYCQMCDFDACSRCYIGY